MIPAHQTNFAQLIDDVKMSLAAEDEEEATSLCIAPQFRIPSETIGAAICSPRLNRFQLRFQRSNLREAINRWEKQDFHTVSASIDFVKSSLPINLIHHWTEHELDFVVVVYFFCGCCSCILFWASGLDYETVGLWDRETVGFWCQKIIKFISKSLNVM